MEISIKTPKQIQIMHEGGKKLSSTLSELFKMIKPSINLLDIEKKAVQLLKAKGGEPGFARVPGYDWATCLNINDEIVHGVPKDYEIKAGDVVNIDIGMYYKGFNTDMSSTLCVENEKLKIKNKKYKEVEKFLKTGRRALKEATKQVKPGNYIGHISQKIQEIVEGAGYSCARNLTGHGIGRKLHEPPHIPCFLSKPIKETPRLEKGMAIAIEVIYAQGNSELFVDPKDKWTIRTKDGKISAVFEQTIAVTSDGYLILTELP